MRLQLVLPLPTNASKKNHAQIRRDRTRRRQWIAPGADAQAAEAAIRSEAIAQLAAHGVGFGRSLFGSRPVSVSIDVDWAGRKMVVEVVEAPTRAARRADLHSIVEVTMDALQGVVFDDDAQVTALTLAEWRGAAGVDPEGRGRT